MTRRSPCVVFISPLSWRQLFWHRVAVSSKQVTPAELSSEMTPEICLIPAEGLREGFNTTYENLLKSKGFHTRQMPPGSALSSCPLSTTYIGTWSWDLAIYMSYADIRVYQYGQQVGQAEYDSRWGGGRVLDKFINAEKKYRAG